jgi:menaquinone-dependent protoporphyrinogen IX oxidase
MKALIIYKSKTGFTKWYAEFIAKEVEVYLIKARGNKI